MRGILALALACFFAVPVAALPPLVPVVATGDWNESGHFVVRWDPPAAGGNGMMGYIVYRYVGGELAETVNLGPAMRQFVDDAPAESIVEYVVHWTNAEGISPGSNPIVRGPYPYCNALGLDTDELPPGHQIRPECVLPPPLR